nr:RNA polymerase II second largest subunit [Tanacetum cinerariifolium]
MVVPDVDSKPPEELRVYGIFKGNADKRTSFLWLTFIAKSLGMKKKRWGLMVVPDVDSKPPEELRVYGIFKGNADKRTSFLCKVIRDEEKKMGTLFKEDFCCSNRDTTTNIRHGCYDKLDDDSFAPPIHINCGV